MNVLVKNQRSLQEELDHIIASVDVFKRYELDPVRFVHEYQHRQDQEIVALIASMLAFGRVTSIRTSIRQVLDQLGDSPSQSIVKYNQKEFFSRLGTFRHRVYRGEHLIHVLISVRNLLKEYGSIENIFIDQWQQSNQNLQYALAGFARMLRGQNADRGLQHLIPDPIAGSACKRLLLFLRWMIRPADGVDLGLWKLPPSILLIPVDTHVHQIAKKIGLTKRNDASWKTSVEITEQLRLFDPLDPVKYDFAICHYGMMRHHSK